VLALVVAIEESLGDASGVGVQSEGAVGHAGYGFEDHGVVRGFVWGSSPSEGSVAVD